MAEPARKMLALGMFLAASLLSFACVGAEAELELGKRVQIEVQVNDEGGAAIEGASLIANEQTRMIGGSGSVAVSVSPSRRYQLTALAPGYYTMIHTFSEQERRGFDGRFPAITLVKKIPGRVMLALAGDTMMGRRYSRPNPGDPRLLNPDTRGEDSKALLRTIEPYLALADYVSINLETPVLPGEPREKSTKGVTFYSYPEILGALSWAGVDHVSLGNNHSYDYLEAALAETLDRVAQSGLGFSGAGMNASSALKPHRTSIFGVDYSFFGYVGWPGKVVPNQVAQGSKKGGAALGTKDNMVNSVAAERSDRVLVVEYHGGDEYSYQPTQETRERAHAAIDSGADLVIGHHPHVLHGFEIYKGKLIAYSLGNFMFDQYIYETQRSALLYVWMDGEEFHRAEVVPLYIKTYRPTPALGRMRDYVLRRLRQQSSIADVSPGMSGGHAVIGPMSTSPAHGPERAELEDVISNGLMNLDSWRERFDQITFDRAGVSYRVGRDWWSLGDFEQEQQFQLVDKSWWYSNGKSGVTAEHAIESYALKVSIPSRQDSASVGQQYFMRAWDEQPMTVAVQAYSEADFEVRACMELRTRAMTTTQGRLQPVVHCMNRVAVSQGEWQQLLFDFEPPARADHRGMRFRFDVFSTHEAATAVYLDDLKFISWEISGTSLAHQTLPLGENKRWNVLEILSPVSSKSSCCQLLKMRN